MNPDADDLYDCLGAHPQEPHGDLKKKVSRFVALHGTDYPSKKTKIQRKLKDLDSRKEYNDENGYPTVFGDVVPISISGPDVVEVGETVTIVVEDDKGDPVDGASITAGGADLGETSGEGKCSFEFHAPGMTTLEASKTGSDETYTDATSKIEIVKERRELSVKTGASKVVVGETVSITVTAAGEPVPDAVVVTDGETKTTNTSGTCRIEYTSTGEKTVEASKDDDGEATYIDDVTTLEVEKEAVSLNISADSHNVEVGETVSFSVSDDSGNAISAVSLSYSGGTATTDTNGRASVTLEEAGESVIEASKRDDPTTHYNSDKIEIVAGRRHCSLSVEISPNPVEIGNSVTVRVTADGTPVSDVSVTAASQTKKTDGSGLCTFDFSSVGKIDIEATKDDTPTTEYDSGSTTITVNKATRALTIEPARDTVEIREELTVRVSDGTGSITNALLKGPSSRKRTDDRGTCLFQFHTTGEVELTATRSDTKDVAYGSASTTVTVEPKQIDLELTGAPDEVEIGEDIEVSVKADGDPVPDVNVRTDGEVEQTNSEGACTFTPSSIGTIEIAADKDDTDLVEYLPDKDTINVEPVTKDLYIDVPDEAESGGSVQVTVYDEGGGRVGGATVESPSDRAHTDNRGTCSVAVPTEGRSPIHLSVEKGTEDGIHYGTDRSPIEVEGLDLPDEETGAPTAVVVTIIGIILVFPAIGVGLLFGIRGDLIIGSLVLFLLLGVSILGLTRRGV